MSYASEVLADSPLAYWALDETSGTNADDGTANNRDLTYDAGVNLGVPGPVSGALAAEFDGNPQRITRADDAAFDALASLTLECWVYLDVLTGGTGSSHQMFMHKWTSSGDDGFYLARETGPARLRFTTGGSTRNNYDNNWTAPTGTWVHLVATFDGPSDTKRVYIDGAEFGTGTTWTGTITANSVALQLGNFSDGSWQLDGRMCRVAIYDAALSAARIEAHYDAGIAEEATGEVASVIPSVTQDVTGGVASAGTAAHTIPSVTQDVTGDVEVTAYAATAAQTIPSVTQDATGEAASQGTAAQAVPSVTQDAVGFVPVQASAASVIPSVRQSARGPSVASEGVGAPVLLLAPPAIGRVFHEVSFQGEVYHPSVGRWEATEEAPGGMGPGSGTISERVWRGHREVFQQGAIWRTFLESDGTCISAGRLGEPDPSGGAVLISHKGRAVLAERELGGVVYQIRDIDQWGNFSTPVDNEGPKLIVPVWTSPLTRFACRLELAGTDNRNAKVTISTATMVRHPNGEIQAQDPLENWFGHLGSSTGTDVINVDIDLRRDSGGLSSPNDDGDNEGGNPAHAEPTVLIVSCTDDLLAGDESGDEQSVTITKARLNGAAVGDSFTASDLVLDICGRLGITSERIEATGFNILPHVLNEDETAAEALDFAALISGWRWLIYDTGSRARLEFGPYHTRRWSIVSPHDHWDPIPQERYDVVQVPFWYADKRITGLAKAILDPSPLERRNVYGKLSLTQPAAHEDKAKGVGDTALELLSRKRWAGDFQVGTPVRNGEGALSSPFTIRAGDIIGQLDREEGRMRIGTLSKSVDGVRGSGDPEIRALDKMLARRDKRLERRRVS